MKTPFVIHTRATEDDRIKDSMHHFELTPLLTDADAVESSEGGLDPLGTESLADKLAVKLVPGVRERQQHPRFLTATAVSLSLCAEFGDEVLARDGVSEPWLVFEWYVVEGLVRTRGLTPKDIRGLPGREKAARAIADGVPLSTKRYLKTPSVFGFHGIYRALALTLGIQHGERLGERGCELLALWAKERGLGGFVGTAGGPGKHFREQIGEALRLGLEKGAVARTKAWAGWDSSRSTSPLMNLAAAKQGSYLGCCWIIPKILDGRCWNL